MKLWRPETTADLLERLLTIRHWHSLTMLRGAHLHSDEIPPGTLYLLILKTLARSGEMHGYEIANSIQSTSDDVLQV